MTYPVQLQTHRPIDTTLSYFNIVDKLRKSIIEYEIAEMIN